MNAIRDYFKSPVEAGTTLQQLRDRLVNQSLFFLSVISLPAIVSSLLRANESGWQVVMTMQLILFLIVLITVVFRKRIAFFVRTAVLLGSILLLGIVGLLSFGLAGIAVLTLALVCLLTAVLLGKRAAIFALLINLTIVAIVGIGATTGRIAYTFDANLYIVSPDAWIFAFMGIAVFAGFSVIGVGTTQAQLHQALQASESHYKTLFDKASDAIYISNLHGKLLDVNQMACDQLGYSRDQLLGMKVSDILVREYAEQSQQRLAKLVDVGQFVFDTAYVHKNGRVIPNELSATIIEHRGETAVLGIARDVTKRLQEQADLAASEAMLRNIFQAVPLGVVMVQDRIITFSNSKISRMLGFGKDELIGQSARILYPDGEEFFRVGQEKYPILSEKGAASIETRFQKKNGKVIDILMHSTPLDPLDISAGVISTAINITEQKEMESALRKNEARYRNIFETTAVSIWEEDFSAVKAAIGAKKAEGVTDFRTYFDTHPDFLLQQLELIKIVDVNEAAVKMYKAASKEELMNSLERTFVPESLATFKEEIVAIAEGKPHFTAEGVTKALDGERVEVIVTMTFPKEAALWENVTVGMVDITERNRVAAALRESEDRLSKIRIAANDGTWDWNLKTNHLYFDPRYYEMAGYDVNEFPHRFEEFQKRIHPDDAFIVMDQARKHLGKEIDRFDVEFRFKKKDDSWLWILGKGVVVEWDKYGDPVRFLGTHTDIMDRKLAEDSLQKYAKRLETLQKVTAVLTTTLALEEVLSNILEQLALVIDFDNTTIFLREGNQVRMVTLQGDIYPQQLIGKLYPLDNPLFLEIQTTAQTLCLADVQVDPRFQNWGDVNEVHGWMGVPLLVRDELIGFLTLDSYQVDIYGLDEAEMVRPFADQAAQAIENARLHEQVKRNVAELDERVRERTEKLNMLVSAMTGREVRMAELKKVIKKLRKQLKDAGIKPIANDPLIAD